MLFKRKKQESLEELEKNVFLSLQYYRLAFDLDQIDIELSNYQTNDNVGKYDVLGRLNNYLNNNIATDLKAERDKVSESLNKIKEEHTEDEYKLVINGGIKDSLSELFKNDTYQLNKYLISIRLVLDTEYSYRENKKSLNEISAILYNGEKNKLNEINSRLESVYMKIAKKPFTNTQKACLIGLATLSVLSLGIAIPFTEATLAVGGSAIGGLLAVGIVSGAMSVYNKTEARNDYKNLTVEESAFFLTIKSVLIEKAREMMPEIEFKENLNQILSSIDDMKSEVNYLLFVEKESVEVNKEKLQQFHNFDKFLINSFSL